MLTEYDRRAIEATIDLYPELITNECINEYIEENTKEIVDAYTSNVVINTIAKDNYVHMQVLENTNRKLVLNNDEKKVYIGASVHRPKIIAADVSMPVYRLLRNLSNEINNDVKGSNNTINLQNLDETFPEVLYYYVKKKYEKLINSGELIFNENDISVEFMNVNVSFKFNYLVNLDNVKKVEYIMYSLLQNLDL